MTLCAEVVLWLTVATAAAATVATAGYGLVTSEPRAPVGLAGTVTQLTVSENKDITNEGEMDASVQTYTVSINKENEGIDLADVAESPDSADSVDGAASWRCPRGCSCVAQAAGTDYNCSLPGGLLRFEEYGDGINFKCSSGGSVLCAEVPARAAGAAGALSGALSGALRSVTFRGCALPPEPLLCTLRRRGAHGTAHLSLVEPRTPLEPEHVRGLRGITMLRITDLDGRDAELPLRAIAELPELRQLMVDNARLRLPGSLPPLGLEVLELADDALERLPRAAFRNLTHLRRLSLWKNNLTDLPEDTFEGLAELRDLSLSSNQLRRLPARLLAHTPRLAHLDLYDNPLEELPADLLAGLAHLQQLRLMYNRVNLTLGTGAFRDLAALEELELSGSALYALPADALRGCRALRVLLLQRCALRELPAALLRGLARLERLDLSENAITHIPPGFFSDLQNLTDLNLDRNQLKTLPSKVFLGLGRLETLSINRNQLAHISYDAFVGVRSLRELSLSHNLLTLAAPDSPGARADYESLGEPSPFSALTLLSELDLSHNRVRALLDDWRTVLVTLRRLDLSWNNITDLNYVNMNFLSTRLTVHLQHNNISTVSLWGPSGGNAVFLLDDNPFSCDCRAPALQQALAAGSAAARPADGPRLSAPGARCAAPPELRGRPLLSVPRDALACPLTGAPCPSICSCLVRPDYLDFDCDSLPDNLPSPQEYGLDASKLRLRSAPAAVRPLQGVNELNLAHLNMTEPPPIPAGLEVDLTGNLLTRIPPELLANNTLRLAGNRLACDCRHSADVAALKRASSAVRDFRSVRCAGGAPLHLVEAETLCEERNRIILGIALGAAALILLVVILLLRRYGLRLLAVILGSDCCHPEEDNDFDKKEYDAFISFAHRDLNFAEEIVLKLEAPPYALRTCVHYRDWPVGDWIPAQIARSVIGSRRTVILLSRDFLLSVWGLLEFREAHLRALKEGQTRMVVVLLGDVMSDPLMTDELRAYLATTTYLHRDDPRFWHKLVNALRPRRGPIAAVRRAGRRRAVPAAAPAPLAPTPLADKLLRSALETKLTQDGKLINAAFTAPSL